MMKSQTLFLLTVFIAAATNALCQTDKKSPFIAALSTHDHVNTTEQSIDAPWLHVSVIEPSTDVRPFITDDSRVVGNRLAQLESWFRYDRESAQQWIMAAYGPTDRLELSIGGVLGRERNEKRSGFSYALPLVQGKYLFRPYAPGKGPGFGMVAGTFLPAGKGSFKPAGYGSFAFATITQCFGQEENYLFHLNFGGNYLHVGGEDDLIKTWGFGTQIKTVGGFHLVGEIFSGDPYVPGAGLSYQAGFRHFFSDLLQIDMTVGEGIRGVNPLPLWISAGVRIVFTNFRH